MSAHGQTEVRPRVGPLAAYVGGALTAAGALSVGVLFGQAVLARWTIPGAEEPPPRCGGDYGTGYAPATPLRMAVLGDSTAAGYGVRTREQTPGALLARDIAAAARRPVRLTCPAVVGSVSAWLPAQVEMALEVGPALAVIFIGANDVTTRADGSAAVGYLADAVRDLRAAGAEVVVATCPDLGTIRPIQPPLRWAARYWSRQLAAAQTVAVVRAGGRAVSLGDLLGPRFAADPVRMFAADRYHPSAEGYRAAIDVVLPSALAALGLAPERATPSTSLPSLPAAAVAAADRPGTETRPADVAPVTAVAPAAAPPSAWARLRAAVAAARRSTAPTPTYAVPSVSTPVRPSAVMPSGAD
jgi:lysophospholipase L1-like esterase